MLSVFGSPARARSRVSTLQSPSIVVALTCAAAIAFTSAAVAQTKRPVSTPQISRALVAVVSLRNQTIDVYDANGHVTRSSISSGQSGYETPRGVFSIIQKNEEHYSNLYDDAPMPFMQRITWSGVALHAGNVPGYPASHGCIRMPYDFAQKMFSMTQMGMRVIVTGGSPAPASITHAKLMSPISVDPTAMAAVMSGESKDLAFAGVTEIRTEVARVASNVDRGARDGMQAPMRLGVPMNDAAQSPLPSLVPAASPLAASGRFLDAARADASAQVVAADRRIAGAKAELGKTQRDNAVALRSTSQAEKALADAERRLTAAGLARAKARTEKDAVRAEEAELRAEIDVLTARNMLDSAGPDAVAARALVASADAALKQAEADRAAKQKAARELDRKAKPISVFVSRKTQRLYIRQGFEPVIDIAIEIQDPSRPIGTHVFTAMASKYEPASASWHVVTVTDQAGGATEQSSSRAKKGEVKTTPTRVASAAEALDRVTIPDAISRQIAESVRAGASLIISDEGISNETGKGTDFVILTK